MLLALLTAVPGRLGGPPPMELLPPPGISPEAADRGGRGAFPGAAVPMAGDSLLDAGLEGLEKGAEGGPVMFTGGVPAGRGGTGGVGAALRGGGGTPEPLTALLGGGPPLGGGGVGVAADAASGPAFGLTHRLSSLS